MGSLVHGLQPVVLVRHAAALAALAAQSSAALVVKSQDPRPALEFLQEVQISPTTWDAVIWKQKGFLCVTVFPLANPPFTFLPSGKETNAWKIADQHGQTRPRLTNTLSTAPQSPILVPRDAGGVPPSELTAVNVPGVDWAFFLPKRSEAGRGSVNGTRMGVTSVIQLRTGSHAIQVLGPPPTGLQGVFRVFGTAGKYVQR